MILIIPTILHRLWGIAASIHRLNINHYLKKIQNSNKYLYKACDIYIMSTKNQLHWLQNNYEY